MWEPLMKVQNLIPPDEAHTRSKGINPLLAVWNNIDIMSSWNCRYKKIQKERKIQNKQNSEKEEIREIYVNLCKGNEIQGNICENTEIRWKLRKSMQLWEINEKELKENI